MRGGTCISGGSKLILYELQHFCGCALRNGEVKHGDLPKEDSQRHILTGLDRDAIGKVF